MSSISSGVDPVVKYQRLSAEYVKIRNQVSILKTALLEEQAKTNDLQRENTVRETKLRKVENERDSLAFRNDQLVKRVESLQENLEAQMAVFGTGKGKKRHKEANLRLVAESSRMQHQALGGAPSASNPQMVLEEELERKIVENGQLHSKLFDMERRFEGASKEFIQRIEELQRENAHLRSSNSQGENAMVGKPREAAIGADDELTSQPVSFDLNKSTLANGNGNGGGDGSECDSTGTGEQNFTSTNSRLDPATRLVTTTSSRSSDGKPSDSAFSLDSVEPAESEEMAAKRKMLDEYYTDRISTLTKSLQHATGRAAYYKQECEELVRRNLAERREVENLHKKIHELDDKCAMLYETLETTQQNYEEQMRQLAEHMANQDARIADQADRLVANNNNGDDENGGHLRQKKKVAENGQAVNKKEKRTSWFSSPPPPSSSSASK